MKKLVSMFPSRKRLTFFISFKKSLFFERFLYFLIKSAFPFFDLWKEMQNHMFLTDLLVTNDSSPFNTSILVFSLVWKWAGCDSNTQSPKATDLQSVCFTNLPTYPIICFFFSKKHSYKPASSSF